jgi:hypothetical protein
MARDRTRRRGAAVAWIATAIAAVLIISGLGARADRIVLRGGGQIRGKVLPDPKRPDRVTILTERGKTPLSLLKAQVTEVAPEPSALDEYVKKREAAGRTAEAQYDLGAWCEGVKLLDLATLHYEAAVALDATFGPAHQKLGHVKYGDHWLKPDELRAAQGLVRDHGQWITREEKSQRESDRELADEESSWAKRIRVLREAMSYGADDRQREAKSQLLAIDDPAAVAPLVAILGNDQDDDIRLLLARVLAKVKGPKAARAIVNALVRENVADVREAFLDALESRKDAEVTTTLHSALKAESSQVVNRAAWALGRLNAVGSVPNLANALISTRVQSVMGQAAAPPVDAPAFNATFGSIPPTSTLGAAPIAYNGSSVGFLTGPVVGPGVAAYGAAAVPFYDLPNPVSSLPSPFGGSASIGATAGIPGGGGLGASRGPTPRFVTVTVQNTEVHASLVRLTGEDFGFNVGAWKRWVASSFRPNPKPSRRVPQP